MKGVSVIAALTLLTGVLAGGSRTRPWELVIQTGADNDCEFISFRASQLHKELSLVDRNVVREVTVVPAPHPSGVRSVVRALSYDVPTLVSQAQLHCPNDLSDLLFRRVTGSSKTLDSQSILSDKALSLPAISLNPGIIIPPLEVIGLVTSGPSDNRVDLAFFSDGYTLDERQKFLDDASRLANDISANQTFSSVKPLLNFWAVFSPSKDSGVGVGGRAKDTPFGLYRDGTELRGLYANNSEVALAACASLGDRCNYAILLGNDPFYGGLGGEYTTTTASLANGALVLRHELGHSIIDVGEEYDGGFAYFGVNAIHDVSNVTWSHWLTQHGAALVPRVECSAMSMQAYPWTLLDIDKPWLYTFTSSGLYSRHLVKFSLSGIACADDLVVHLDGVDLKWVPRKDIGVDRWHYDILLEEGLTEGEHMIEFILKNKETQGQAQLCSVEILEYGTHTEFNATEGNYGLYPTYNLDNETSYRPTNDDCLMRSVTKPNFCNVCLEGLWLSLMKRVDLIETIRSTCTTVPLSNRHLRTIEVDVAKLAQFREEPIERKESYAITWSSNGRVLDRFANRTQIKVPDEPGIYHVDVVYSIEEVRLDPGAYLTASRTYEINGVCA
ncbi:IgA peptidase M64-domain-containing protein [Phlebopus sp. FC_14]|nr:IgA peptidase M64-domain-containing protein [Phlebopus sp. FC_14]